MTPLVIDRRAALAGLVALAGCARARPVARPVTLPAAGGRLDAAFPGGNIVVEGRRGDQVFLKQDLRDTRGNWFYWAFRARGFAGQEVTFRFTGGKVVGVRGPAVSHDGGVTWSWLRGGFDPVSFRHAFASGADDVRFAMAVPYLERDLAAFLGAQRPGEHLQVETLCRSRKGRSIERIGAGRLDGGARRRVLLTARHHACESMASFVLEGILAGVLAADEEGAWLRDNVELMAVPFMDKDGVEEGDQGKNRRPRDHNRDYAGASLYPSVRALREQVPAWAADRLALALDLHCPGQRGRLDETVFFVGSRDPDNWRRIQELSTVIERVQRGPIAFSARNNLPYGTAWNTSGNEADGKSFASWARELPGTFATTLEVAYANANGTAVTASSARSLGQDLARALRHFLA
jgi:hypothetical protein